MQKTEYPLFMKKIFWLVVISFALVGCLLPLSLYLSKFSGSSSKNSQDWSNFGGFWAPFVAISNTLSIIVITAYFQKMEWSRNAILERPVIAILRTKNADGYQLVNVGKGAALNITTLVASSESFAKEAFIQNRICYSLRSGDDFSKPWLNGMLIIVSYDDIFNTTYYSMMQDDELHLFDGEYKPLSKGTTDETTVAKFKMYGKQFERPAKDWP